MARGCMARGYVWQGEGVSGRGVHGGGMHGRGCVWHGGVRGRRDGHCSGLVRILLECILVLPKTARK